jgi:hypothetical protein
MKKAVFAVVIAALACSAVSFAATTRFYYAITNDDNPAVNGNTATVFQFTPSAGALTVSQTLFTGGTGLGGVNNYDKMIAITRSGKCLFVADSASGDIASFTAITTSPLLFNTTPVLISTGTSVGNPYGIPLAVTPSGKYLFAGFASPGNVVMYKISFNTSGKCMLHPTFNQNYSTPVGGLAVTNDNNVLVVVPGPAGATSQFVDTYRIGAGTLAHFGPTLSLSTCTGACYPQDVDISNVIALNATVVMANIYFAGPYYITANLNEYAGLTAPANNLITGTALSLITSLFYSPAGAAGTGPIYFGGGCDSGTAPFFGGADSNPIALSLINPAATGSYAPPPASQPDYYKCSNVQSISRAASVVHDFIWQSASTSGQVNTMYLYKVTSGVFAAAQPFASLANPNANGTSFVRSLVAFPTR